MGIRDFLANLFAENPQKTAAFYTEEVINSRFYKGLATETCINYIASTMSLCEFQTKKNGQVNRGAEYWRLNVEANANQSAAYFWRSVIEKLVAIGECLVVKVGDSYYVAHSYTRTEHSLSPTIYSDVMIGRDNPEKLTGSFKESQVWFFRWNNSRIREYIDDIYGDLGTLIAASKDNYMSLSKLKILVKQDASWAQTDANNKAMEELVNEHLKNFIDPSKSNAIPIARGIVLEDFSRKSSGTSSNPSADMQNFIDAGLKQTARAFQIPPSLLSGDVEGIDDAIAQYMTECIKPIVKVISDEINRKMIGRKQYEKGNGIFVDITRIRYADIKDMAASLEALTRIGANTIDDNLLAVGREAIGGEIGGQRWMTKNYDCVEHFYTQE